MSDQSRIYTKQNPLGGPAKIFDAVADSIRAGDSVELAMAQFGLTWAAPSVDRNGGKTGHPPGMLQDDSRKLTKWFAGKPDARLHAREAAAAIAAQAEPPPLSDFDATLRDYAEAVRKLDGPAMRAGYIKLRKMLTGQAEPPQAAQREVREVVEQLIACHDEADCPAVAVAREWLAAQPASLAAPAQPEVPDCNTCAHEGMANKECRECYGRINWEARDPAQPSPPADTPAEAQGEPFNAATLAQIAAVRPDLLPLMHGVLAESQGEREALSNLDIFSIADEYGIRFASPDEEGVQFEKHALLDFARAILASNERKTP